MYKKQQTIENEATTSKFFDNPDNRLLTVEEVAARLRVPKSTIYQWAHKGQIPHRKAGRLLRFKWIEVERWSSRKD